MGLKWYEEFHKINMVVSGEQNSSSYLLFELYILVLVKFSACSVPP